MIKRHFVLYKHRKKSPPELENMIGSGYLKEDETITLILSEVGETEIKIILEKDVICK